MFYNLIITVLNCGCNRIFFSQIVWTITRIWRKASDHRTLSQLNQMFWLFFFFLGSFRFLFFTFDWWELLYNDCHCISHLFNKFIFIQPSAISFVGSSVVRSVHSFSYSLIYLNVLVVLVNVKNRVWCSLF